MSNYTGWDIGGAHIKVANVNNIGKVLYVEEYAAPIWKGLSALEDKLYRIKDNLPMRSLFHGITMTAELADIFKSKKDGVMRLTELCYKVLGENTFFYSTIHGLNKINNIKRNYNYIASANWHASANYVASKIDSGLYIDIGSTTTDIIPFTNNKSSSEGLNDQERLCASELVYSGVIRTPLMSLTPRVKFNGKEQGIVAENFASTSDIYRILGFLKNKDDLMETTDGRSKTIVDSKRRLARIIGMDADEIKDKKDWINLAEYFHKKQLEIITNAVTNVLLKLPKKSRHIVCAGVGQFLVRIIAQQLNVSCSNFSDLVDCDIKTKHKSDICAPAISIAQLNRIMQIK
ncbi:MAG: hypothetical protein CMF40_03535 [Legionellales bacterium]|nr:hypothetical protein [Legionellales bacterium]|tara:strand:- start:261 stop:1301 length:1041 start_codon:yes stop_codon:yes gene_type:complete